MAVFFPQNSEPPSSAFPTFDTRNGVLVLDFDDTTDESTDFGGFIPRHASATPAVTVTIGWMSTDATITVGHQCRWDVQFASVGDDTDDIDAALFATALSVSSDEASVSGEVKYITIAFTNAEADAIDAGEYFRLRINRDANHADDDLTDDAELVFIEIKET